MGKFLHARLRKKTVLPYHTLTLFLNHSILAGETIPHYIIFLIGGESCVFGARLIHSIQAGEIILYYIILYFHWVGGESWLLVPRVLSLVDRVEGNESRNADLPRSKCIYRLCFFPYVYLNHDHSILLIIHAHNARAADPHPIIHLFHPKNNLPLIRSQLLLPPSTTANLPPPLFPLNPKPQPHLPIPDKLPNHPRPARMMR